MPRVPAHSQLPPPHAHFKGSHKMSKLSFYSRAPGPLPQTSMPCSRSFTMGGDVVQPKARKLNRDNGSQILDCVPTFQDTSFGSSWGKGFWKEPTELHNHHLSSSSYNCLNEHCEGKGLAVTGIVLVERRMLPWAPQLKFSKLTQRRKNCLQGMVELCNPDKCFGKKHDDLQMR